MMRKRRPRRAWSDARIWKGSVKTSTLAKAERIWMKYLTNKNSKLLLPLVPAAPTPLKSLFLIEWILYFSSSFPFYCILPASLLIPTPSSLPVTLPFTATPPLPSRMSTFQPACLMNWAQGLTKNGGAEPEQGSWADRIQISPPQSGSGTLPVPGLGLVKRRLGEEGGVDGDTRDSTSIFRPPVKLDNTLLSNVLLTLYIK